MEGHRSRAQLHLGRDNLAPANRYTPLKAENPPSTGITTPVTKAAAGEINHIVAPIRSSGVPKRFIGVGAITDLPRSGNSAEPLSVSKNRFCPLMKNPRAMALARMRGE